MPSYQAMEDGYIDDVYRKKGSIFSSSQVFTPEVLKKSKWLVLLDDSDVTVRTSEVSKDARPSMIEAAIGRMLNEDSEKSTLYISAFL